MPLSIAGFALESSVTRQSRGKTPRYDVLTLWLGIAFWFPSAAMFYTSAAFYTLHWSPGRAWSVGISLLAIWVALSANLIGMKIGKWTENLGGASSWILCALLAAVADRIRDLVRSEDA